jgi:hypothetical protein
MKEKLPSIPLIRDIRVIKPMPALTGEVPPFEAHLTFWPRVCILAGVASAVRVASM